MIQFETSVLFSGNDQKWRKMGKSGRLARALCVQCPANGKSAIYPKPASVPELLRQIEA